MRKLIFRMSRVSNFSKGYENKLGGKNDISYKPDTFAPEVISIRFVKDTSLCNFKFIRASNDIGARREADENN